MKNIGVLARVLYKDEIHAKVFILFTDFFILSVEFAAHILYNFIKLWCGIPSLPALLINRPE